MFTKFDQSIFPGTIVHAQFSLLEHPIKPINNPELRVACKARKGQSGVYCYTIHIAGEEYFAYVGKAKCLYDRSAGGNGYFKAIAPGALDDYKLRAIAEALADKYDCDVLFSLYWIELDVQDPSELNKPEGEYINATMAFFNKCTTKLDDAVRSGMAALMKQKYLKFI